LSGAPVWGVERLAARLDADLPKNVFATAVGQRGSVHGRLRNWLHAEMNVAVAGGIGVAVGGDDAYAEPVGIGVGELGDVGCDRSVAEVTILCVERVEVMLERQVVRFHRRENAPVGRSELLCKFDACASLMRP